MSKKDYHQQRILEATRGSIGDYIDAILDAKRDGVSPFITAGEHAWADRVLKLERKVKKLKKKLERLK